MGRRERILLVLLGALATGILVAALALQGCAPAAPSVPHPETYLAATRCEDGLPAVLATRCSGPALTRASDLLVYRHRDWARPETGQIEDSWVDGDRYVTTFSYPPNRAFVPANGDGGDVLVVDGDRVRIDYTQNGLPGGGTIAGYWVGPRCGGDGWLVFDVYAPSEQWASRISRLAGSTTGRDDCPPLVRALTRWRRVAAPVPFRYSGVQISQKMQVIVSEHYDADAIVRARAMERMVLADGYGRVVWEAWTVNPSDFASPCPGVAPYNVAPASGWHLADRRCPTELVRDSEPMRASDYGWPPTEEMRR